MERESFSLDQQIVDGAITPEFEMTLDSNWYNRFRNLDFPFLRFCSPDKENLKEQKKLFLSDQIVNPSLEYHDLAIVDLDKLENDLLELKSDIANSENNQVIRQAYRWRINEKIAKLRMLKACKGKNDRKFLEYSIFVYGKPSPEVYSYSLNRLTRKIERAMSNGDQEVQKAALRLQSIIHLDRFSHHGLDSSILLLPPKISQAHDPHLTIEEIKQEFEAVLAALNVHGWKVIIDQSGRVRNFTVSQIYQSILIPGDEELMIRKKAITKHVVSGLIAHEMTHVKRRLAGERTKLQLLAVGLDRYLKADEGIATYMEQKILGANDFAGFLGHFTISLALGLDGHKRTFREVFETLLDYEIMSNRESSPEFFNKARELVWKRCLRVFRGTSGQSAGCVLTKDIVYREGNIAIWQLLKNNPGAERMFMIGKYDPTNPRHIWILDQLGITEGDLRSLEE